jgi:hypothetical protein
MLPPRATGLALRLAMVASALFLAGCHHTLTLGTTTPVRVALTEYHLVPQDVRIPAGTVIFDVHNYGRLTHNLAISAAGKNKAVTRPIPPGTSAVLDVFLPPGKYLMESTILDDVPLGLYGSLTVTK